MEGQQTIVLKNLPIATRNYTVVDTATGKPIDNATYSLTIAPHVIEKLYELKRINEEKKQQAALRQQYAHDSLTTAYTPTDNSVFTPLTQGDGEYIDIRDMRTASSEYQEQDNNKHQVRGETMQSEGILGRVTARAPEQEYKEITLDEPQKPELDYITAETYQQTQNYEYDMPPVRDNSTFDPTQVNNYSEENAINARGDRGTMEETEVREKKQKKEKKQKRIPGEKRPDYIDLTPEEIKAGRGVAWLAYILFFIPLIFKGKNRFVRIHANEGLDLNIAELIGVLLGLPFLLVSNPTGTLEIVIYIAAILGAVILAACAITIIPVMIGALCGAQFQIPWLSKKRIIRVNKD